MLRSLWHLLSSCQPKKSINFICHVMSEDWYRGDYTLGLLAELLFPAILPLEDLDCFGSEAPDERVGIRKINKKSGIPGAFLPERMSY